MRGTRIDVRMMRALSPNMSSQCLHKLESAVNGTCCVTCSRKLRSQFHANKLVYRCPLSLLMLLACKSGVPGVRSSGNWLNIDHVAHETEAQT